MRVNRQKEKKDSQWGSREMERKRERSKHRERRESERIKRGGREKTLT